MSNKAPFISVTYHAWLQTFRGITTATNERTLITTELRSGGVGNSAPISDYGPAPAIAAALVMANMNSIPLDWTARFSVGGVNMNFFIVKQLPVLPPEAYLEDAGCGSRYVELVTPRVLNLTYTSQELEEFAADLGYSGDPFPWEDLRRQHLQCELDAIFSHMYRLDRQDVEWILDSPPPSASFPRLKLNELEEFGEYRTKRYVLSAFDLLAKGEDPSIHGD